MNDLYALQKSVGARNIKPILRGFPDSSVGKEFAWNARYPGLIPGSGRSSGEGKGYPLHYSGLENSMDCRVHGVAKSQTQLSDFHLCKKTDERGLACAKSVSRSVYEKQHWLSVGRRTGAWKTRVRGRRFAPCDF